MTMIRVDGVLFDKDGTLFDFGATWNHWAAEIIGRFSEGDQSVARRMAEAVVYDLDAKSFYPESPVIAGTGREAAELLAPILPAWHVDDLEMALAESAALAPQQPPVPLLPLLERLRDVGLRLGVMTNDGERAARANLDGAGVLGIFDFVAGFDSGFGAKPAPDPLLAFADAQGLAPERVVMVGDSTHDLVAGRAAGMQTVAVLTGMALAEDLAPYADAVLPDIGHLPQWLGLSAA